MRFCITFLITVLLLSSSTVCTAGASNSFTVSIVQNDVAQKITGQSITLKPGTFDIIIDMPEPMGVLVHAGLQDNTFKPAVANAALGQLPGFSETGMADHLFNPENQLSMHNDAPNFWFYDSDKEHRFNKAELKNGRITCTRTIKNLYNVNTKTTTQPGDDGDTIYLVFVSSSYDENYNKIEKQRICLAIKWKR